MKVHQPNLDMLSAYADGILSPDAARSMKQHLTVCDVCAHALESEREFVARLDELSSVRPPDDFVNAVMGRVAQYPAYRPAAPLTRQAAVRWSAAASLLLVVLFGTGIAWLVGSGVLQGAEPGTWAARIIGQIADAGTFLITSAKGVAGPALVLLEQAGQIVRRLSTFAMQSGWLVQLTLLVLTVMLNYAFTRIVLNYQRRTR